VYRCDFRYFYVAVQFAVMQNQHGDPSLVDALISSGKVETSDQVFFLLLSPKLVRLFVLDFLLQYSTVPLISKLIVPGGIY
jgi:hypothetical protein